MKSIKKYLQTKQNISKNKSIHTSKHALAEELAEYFNEIKDYRKYLGICYHHSEEKIREVFAKTKEDCKRNYKLSPVKIFFWKIGELKKTNDEKNIQKRRKSTTRKGKRGTTGKNKG